MNKSSNKQDEILRKLYEVERDYQFAIKKDIKQRKAIEKALDNIAFDLNEANFKQGQHKVYDQLEIVAASFNTKTEEKHLKNLEKIMTNFTNVINHMFGKVSQVKRPNINIDDIEVEGFEFDEDNLKEFEVHSSKEHKVNDRLSEAISKLKVYGESFRHVNNTKL